MHSTLGFAAGFIAPLIFGLALDSCGGETSAVAWGWAFVTLGAGGLIAPMLLGFAHRLLDARSQRALVACHAEASEEVAARRAPHQQEDDERDERTERHVEAPVGEAL